ncbi:MAG: hypothetical protein RLY93_19495 [Sumerlaeia bacterium]
MATDSLTPRLDEGGGRFFFPILALGLWVLLAVWSPAPAAAQQSEAERFARAREVEQYKSEIRRLYNEGDYAEVVAIADLLLELDPGNSTAQFWRELAADRIKTRQALPDLGSRPRISDPTPTPRAAPSGPFDTGGVGDSPFDEPGAVNDPFGSGVEDDPFGEDGPGAGVSSTPAPAATPAPAQPTKKYDYKPSRSSNLLLIVIIVVAVVAVLLILGTVVIWFMSRRSKKGSLGRPDAVTRSQEQTHFAGASGIADMPTNAEPMPDLPTGQIAEYDEKTQQEFTDVMSMLDRDTAFQSPEQTAGILRDVPTEMENRRQGESQVEDIEETGGQTFDGIELSEPMGGYEDDRPDPNEQSVNTLLFGNEETLPPPGLAPKPAPAKEKKPEPDPVSFDTMMFSPEPAKEEPKPKAEPKAKAPEPEEDDPNALSINSLMFSNEETVAPPGMGGKKSAAEEPPAAEEDDANAMSYNSLMFGGNEETMAPPGTGGPSKPPQDVMADSLASGETKPLPDQKKKKKNEDAPEELSYNSLMFGNNEETLSSVQPDEPTELVDDYEKMMFGGGDDDTVALSSAKDSKPAPPAKSPRNAAAENAIEDTIRLDVGYGGAEAHEDEPTINLDDVSLDETIPDGGLDLFESSKSQGLSALKAGDYGKAVKSLSVAASLRPQDNQVAQKLAEAKKLRK